VRVWCDRADVTIEPAAEKGQLTVTVPAEAPPGGCWVRLFDDEGAGAPRRFEIGLAPDVTEAEPNNEPRQPQLLPAEGSMVNGRFEQSGDVDVFAVDAAQGQTVVAALAGNGPFGSPCDGVLQVLSTDGFVLAQNDDGRGLDPLIAYTVPTAGRYLVRAFAFPAAPDTAIRLSGGAAWVYRLTVTCGPFVDYPLPLAVPAAEPGRVELVGWNIPDAARSLDVPPPSGPIAGDSLSVLLAAPGGNAVGVVLEPHPAMAEAESEADPQQSIALPVTVSGRIDPAGDADTFRFAAKAGESLTFAVHSRSLGFPLDAVLAVADAEGKQLVRVDDGPNGQPDPVLTFQAPADGEYRLTVADLAGHGGIRYAYRLVGGPVRPDYALGVAADAFTLTVGTPLEVPVTIERMAGYSDPIEVAMEGLPDGVTCAAVTSQPSGDTATAVKLTLTATAPVSGPLRIVGRAGTSMLPVRMAQGPSPVPAVALDHLWITVRTP
jgi:hypothetical protein